MRCFWRENSIDAHEHTTTDSGIERVRARARTSSGPSSSGDRRRRCRQYSCLMPSIKVFPFGRDLWGKCNSQNLEIRMKERRVVGMQSLKGMDAKRFIHTNTQ